MFGDYGLEVLLGLIIIGTVGGVAFSIWHTRRKNARRHNALLSLARTVGGTLIEGAHNAAPRSTALRPPFSEILRGSKLDAWSVRRAPRYEVALDMQRAQWPVRVTQASMRQQVDANRGPDERFEHRVEVAVNPTPELAISRLSDLPRLFGRTYQSITLDHYAVDEEMLARPPVTTQQRGQGWHPVRLPAANTGSLCAYTSDQAFAGAVLNETTLGWFTTYAGQASGALIVENGLLYMTWPGKLEPETIMQKVDFLLGFADRSPIQPVMPPPRPPAVDHPGMSTSTPAWRESVTRGHLAALVVGALATVAMVAMLSI